MVQNPVDEEYIRKLMEYEESVREENRKASEEYKEKLQEADIKIYVRRGGPNYEQGLRLMRDLGRRLGVPIEVHGPETHMTRIVPLALEGASQ